MVRSLGALLLSGALFLVTSGTSWADSQLDSITVTATTSGVTTVWDTYSNVTFFPYRFTITNPGAQPLTTWSIRCNNTVLVSGGVAQSSATFGAIAAGGGFWQSVTYSQADCDEANASLPHKSVVQTTTGTSVGVVIRRFYQATTQPTLTPTPAPPTATPTPTVPPTATPTPTTAPTDTPTPVPTNTPTAVPTSTPTPTDVPVATATPTPTTPPTSTPTAEPPTATATPQPTNTPGAYPSGGACPTPGPGPSSNPDYSYQTALNAYGTCISAAMLLEETQRSRTTADLAATVTARSATTQAVSATSQVLAIATAQALSTRGNAVSEQAALGTGMGAAGGLALLFVVPSAVLAVTRSRRRPM